MARQGRRLRHPGHRRRLRRQADRLLLQRRRPAALRDDGAAHRRGLPGPLQLAERRARRWPRQTDRRKKAEIVPLRPRGKCPICGKPADRKLHPVLLEALRRHRPQPLAHRLPMRFPRSRRRSRQPRRTAMAKIEAKPVSLRGRRRADGVRRCSSLPKDARALYVLAHGAGAGMAHPFLARWPRRSPSAASRTLRYQFPYMEAGSRRPDSPAVAQADRPRGGRRGRPARARPAADRRRQIVRRPHDLAGRRRWSRCPASSASPSSAFRCTRPASPATERGDHLFDVTVPMLFLQGTRDEFADLTLLEPLCQTLGQAGDAPPDRGRQPFLPGAGADRPQGRRNHAPNWPIRSPAWIDKSSGIGGFRARRANWTPGGHFNITADAPRGPFVFRGAWPR